MDDVKITKETAGCWQLNEEYFVSKSDGQIINKKLFSGKEIPQAIYDKRDQLIFNNK